MHGLGVSFSPVEEKGSGDARLIDPEPCTYSSTSNLEDMISQFLHRCCLKLACSILTPIQAVMEQDGIHFFTLKRVRKPLQV